MAIHCAACAPSANMDSGLIWYINKCAAWGSGWIMTQAQERRVFACITTLAQWSPSQRANAEDHAKSHPSPSKSLPGGISKNISCQWDLFFRDWGTFTCFWIYRDVSYLIRPEHKSVEGLFCRTNLSKWTHIHIIFKATAAEMLIGSFRAWSMKGCSVKVIHLKCCNTLNKWRHK